MLRRAAARRRTAGILLMLIVLSLLPAAPVSAQRGQELQLYLPQVTSAASFQPQAQPNPNPSPNPNFTGRLVGAISTSNTTVKVVFNKAMSNNAIDPANYSIYKENDGDDPSRLIITGASFVDPAGTVVELTTLSQSEVLYRLVASTVHDRWGDPLGPKEVVGGILVDPSSTTFVGTPAGVALLDSDEDGLSDNAEQTGWTIYIYQTDGTVITRHITSDPTEADTDQDGVLDADERAYGSDPRLPDTDGDQLTDYQELNEIYSEPAKQDTDGDELNDGLEYNFFITSPLFADTDGDQLSDGDEASVSIRNPRVADLPKPAIEVGETRLRLDVRFSEETALETRELETKSVESTLTQSNRKEFSNMNSNTQEASAKLTVGTEWTVKASINPFDAGAKFTSKVEVETGWTGQWTSEHTETSEQQSEKAFQESLSTEAERTEGATLTREVVGAQVQATVFIKNASNLAYSVRNLQLTAVIQDPLDPTKLTPVATLLPDNEPEEGFTLGPLVPERGPFIFSNETVFPSLVESLMKNPRGLTFIISNFDITDELGRNFAFSSQEVIERTTTLVIDTGSFDADGDGEGDLTEYYRIASNTGRLQDTNEDGVIDEDDRRVVFDGNGKQIGISLTDAFNALGLTHYDEEDTPTASLSEEEILKSYATRRFTSPDGLTEVDTIVRIRNVAVQDGVPKMWEILTPIGIDRTVGPDDLILTTDGDIKLVFVEDIDQDRLPANLEFVNNCSDILVDTDGDGISDLDETLIGWQVDTDRGSYKVFSRCSLTDSDRDGLTDAQEKGDAPMACTVDPDVFAKTDPGSADTDGDGIPDQTEICGYEVTLRSDGSTIFVQTNPARADTDGDTAPDGVELALGGNPRDASDRDSFADDDGDGITNVEERDDGWEITVYAVSNSPAICTTICDQGPATVRHVYSDPFNPDTDGDGLRDGEERSLGTDPSSSDTDGDGLKDIQEVYGFEVRDLGVIVLNPADADSDNDKRSDGAEVEVVDIEASRWIVRLVDQTPYRVYSDPLQADADFDTLADGDEYAAGTDPTKANTDGDTRDDATEVRRNTRPLVEDFMVTVGYRSIFVDDDCDSPDSQAGDYLFEFGANTPLGYLSAVRSSPGSASSLPIRNCTGEQPLDDNLCRRTDSTSLIQIQSDNTLNLGDRSVTFGVARNESFSFADSIGEVDSGYHSSFPYVLSDPFNVTLKMDGSARTGIFRGDELALGTKTGVFEKRDACNLDVRVFLTVE